MNASAAGVLSLCDGARTVGDIVRELAAQHGIDELRASSDAAQILNSFVELRLIALE